MTAEQPARPPRCPICGRPSQAAHRPFCSAHCKHVDLGRWFGETYRVPAAATEEEDAESPAGSDAQR